MTKEINEAKNLLKSMEEIYADNLSKEIAENGIHVVKSHTNQSLFEIIGNLQDKIDNADDALEHLRDTVSTISKYPYFHGASTEFKSSIPAENAESPVETITDAEAGTQVLKELEEIESWMAIPQLEERLTVVESYVSTLMVQANTVSYVIKNDIRNDISDLKSRVAILNSNCNRPAENAESPVETITDAEATLLDGSSTFTPVKAKFNASNVVFVGNDNKAKIQGAFIESLTVGNAKFNGTAQELLDEIAAGRIIILGDHSVTKLDVKNRAHKLVGALIAQGMDASTARETVMKNLEV